MPKLDKEWSEGVEDWRRRSFGAASQIFHDDYRRNWSKWQNRIGAICESDTADLLIGVLIACNSVLVILETNYKGAEEDIPAWLGASTTGLITFFVLELVARLYVYRHFFFKSKWNVFDFFVVVTDVVTELMGKLFGASVPSFSVLRVFRIMRLLRLVEFLTVFSELNMMVRLMFTSLRAMFWGTVLVVVALTLWGIIAVEILHPLNKELAENGAYPDCNRCGRAFESVYMAQITFFQTLIFGDSWGAVALVLIDAHPWTSTILVLSGVTVEVGLLNLIFTVIVDKAREQHEKDTESRLRAREVQFMKAKTKLKEVCRKLDTDNDGLLNLSELQVGFDVNKEFAVSLSQMDLDRENMTTVFHILDEDASGSVTYDEFIEQLYKMKSQDSHTLLLFIKGYINELRGKMADQMKFIKNDLLDKVNLILEKQSPVNGVKSLAYGEELQAKLQAKLPENIRLDLEILSREIKMLSTKVESQSSQMFQNSELLTACLNQNVLHVDKIVPKPPSSLLQTCEVSLPRACQPEKPLTPHTITRTIPTGNFSNDGNSYSALTKRESAKGLPTASATMGYRDVRDS